MESQVDVQIRNERCLHLTSHTTITFVENVDFHFESFFHPLYLNLIFLKNVSVDITKLVCFHPKNDKILKKSSILSDISASL
jgi:hypothetical protein